MLFPANLLASTEKIRIKAKRKQEGLAGASIMRDDPSTLPGDDPLPRAY